MLIFIRHGETILNASKRIQGESELGLNAKGVRQSILAAKYLSNWNISYIYTSDSPRAVQTAKTISTHLNITFTISPSLRERYLDKYDGIKQSDLRKIKEDKGLPSFDPTQLWDDIPGVESDVSVWNRFVNWLIENKINDKVINKNIVAVTHAGVLKSVLYKMMGISSKRPYAIKIPNGSAIFLRNIEGFWSIVELWPNPESL